MESLQTDAGAAPLAEQGYWPAVALCYFDQGKYAKATDLCRRMLEREPQIISARVILARSLYQTGQFEPAKEQFFHVLREDATNLVALKYLGDIMFRDGEEAAAMAYYGRVFELDPCCAGLSCSLDRPDAIRTTHLTLKRPAETVVVRERPRFQEPAFITETVGDIYRDQGYWQLAGEVYRRLLDGNGNNRIADKLKGVEEKLGKKDDYL